jgi:hypothetical protein
LRIDFNDFMEANSRGAGRVQPYWN